MSARLVSERLASEFLRRGNFTAASGPIEITRNIAGISAAAASGQLNYDDFSGFEGLAVQSVGYEDTGEEPAVHIYLTRGSPRQTAGLPKELDGVPIRVHKMGPINVRPETAATATNRGNLFERGGRICCGSSCAPTSEDSTGTFGSLVRGEDGTLFLLSNNHVLAGCNHVPKDQPVMSPSATDGRPDMSAPREVGRHDSIHELRTGEPNFVSPCQVDAALARVTNENIVCSWQGDAQGYDTPSATLSPRSTMRVKKYGRTTGFSTGQVEAYVTTPTPISYTAKAFRGIVYFRNIWSVRADDAGAFALPGDSGSLVVTDDHSAAVGLLFAANRSGDYGWIIPIEAVLKTLVNVGIVSGHGC